jgi:AAA domain/Domain of unknown function (DUF3854)
MTNEVSGLKLTPQHLLDLRGSGLSAELIALAEFRSADRGEVSRILGFDSGSGGLVIPYPGTNGIQPPFVRIKPDKPFADDEGRLAKYLTAKNAGNRLYIPPIYTERIFKDTSIPVILTEGEKKALKGAQELDGFLVLGLAGVWCFKTRDQCLIDDFRKIAFKDRDVYIAYDSDVIQKREVLAAESALATVLDGLGARVNICRIPGSEDKKQGLDDYLIAHSAETFLEQVLDQALIWTPRGTIVVERASELEHKTFPHLPEIIGSGILPALAIAVISAYSKMGKSLLALMISISLAAGKPFLTQFPVGRRWRVLYIQLEISEKSIAERLRKMLPYARSEGFDPGSYLEILNMPPFKIDTDDGLKNYMRIIRAKQPEVVIWDPLYKLHSQDENKSDRMQRVLDKFDYLRSTFHIAQLIIHHHGKPSKDTAARDGFQLMRGSSVFDAFADAYLTLIPHKKAEGSRYQRLIFTLRNAEAPEDLILDRNPETLWYEVVKEADKKTKIGIADVVKALWYLGGKAKRQALIERLKSEYRASERTAIKAINEASELNRIVPIRKEGREVVYGIHD